MFMLFRVLTLTIIFLPSTDSTVKLKCNSVYLEFKIQN